MPKNACRATNTKSKKQTGRKPYTPTANNKELKMTKPAKPFIPLNIAVLTVSDTRTLDEDTSGKYLADSLVEAGHTLAERALTTDCIYQIRAMVSKWIADPNVHAVITNYLDGGMSVQNHKASLKERFEVMRSNYGIVTTVLVHTWFVVRSLFKR